MCCVDFSATGYRAFWKTSYSNMPRITMKHKAVHCTKEQAQGPKRNIYYCDVIENGASGCDVMKEAAGVACGPIPTHLPTRKTKDVYMNLFNFFFLAAKEICLFFLWMKTQPQGLKEKFWRHKRNITLIVLGNNEAKCWLVYFTITQILRFCSNYPIGQISGFSLLLDLRHTLSLPFFSMNENSTTRFEREILTPQKEYYIDSTWQQWGKMLIGLLHHHPDIKILFKLSYWSNQWFFSSAWPSPYTVVVLSYTSYAFVTLSGFLLPPYPPGVIEITSNQGTNNH